MTALSEMLTRFLSMFSIFWLKVLMGIIAIAAILIAVKLFMYLVIGYTVLKLFVVVILANLSWSLIATIIARCKMVIAVKLGLGRKRNESS